MTTQRCPEGHDSSDSDWCSVCGAPMGAGPDTTPTPSVAPPTASAPAAPPTPAATKPCPSCSAANVEDALFCEDCGYDFTTGQRAPAPSSLSLDPPGVPAPTAWVAEVWVDPAWFEANAETATEPCPAAGLPGVVPLRNDVILVGRQSASRGIFPDIDCSADTGVSRRHLQLTLDQDRWYVEDLGSTNGTFVAAGDGSLPQDPIAPSRRRELGENERIYVGAWTRIVIRPATPAEGGA